MWSSKMPALLRIGRLLCVLPCLAPFFSSTVDARVLILRASGPSAQQFRPGRVLSEPLKLKLKHGDRLILLDAKGTRELKGPAVVNDRAREKSNASRLTWDDLVGAGLRVDAAGIRGQKVARERSPQTMPRERGQVDLWQIDPEIAGDWCVSNLSAIEFWRPKSSGPLQVSLAKGDMSAGATWSLGESAVSWPPELLANEEESYTLQVGRGTLNQIVLHKVDLGSDLDELARKLASRGCYHQLRMLLDA